MKKLGKIIKWIAVIVLVIIVTLRLTGNGHLLKGAWAVYLQGHSTASIDDAQYFDTRAIPIDKENTKPWLIHPEYNSIELTDTLRNVLQKTESVAFLVARNDSIIHEEYWKGYSDTSHSNSFSAAKAITTLLVQCAIQDGYFTGWDQKVTEIIPEISGEFANELELHHLAAMTSGMHWDEDYKNPFGVTARAYYSDNVWEVIEELPISIKPGTEFEYQSGSTMLLGMLLIEATGKHLSDYASEKLWKPLNAEHTAYWHIDKEQGTELAYCCFNTNIRDFARFGKLNNHSGNWNGNQVIDSSFYPLSTVPGLVDYYGMGFWLTQDYGTEVFYHRGLHGQYIISIPEYKIIAVRMGEKKGVRAHDKHTVLFHTIVNEIIDQYKIDYSTDSVDFNLNDETTNETI
jgi:CubicO group peptidase (beta-lactamase class C family)